MDVLIFDLDNTLYPAEKHLFGLIDVRINRYMTEIVGIPAPDVDALRRQYDVDVNSCLEPDPELREVLSNLPQRKAVFTNGSICHANRVLAALGIEDIFEEVYDIRVAEYLPKPWPEQLLSS